MYLDPPPGRSSRDSSVPRLDDVKILLVEDDVDLLECMGLYLAGVGASVVCAATVAAGRIALERPHFDLLISDIKLPDGSGHELAFLARAQGAAALALTGGHGEVLIEAARAAGFQSYLTKPCGPETLVRTVERLLRSRD